MQQYRDKNGRLPIAIWEKTLSTSRTQIKLLKEEQKALAPDLSMLQKVQAMIDEVLPPEVSNDTTKPLSGKQQTASKQSIHQNLDQKKKKVIASSKSKTKKHERDSL